MPLITEEKFIFSAIAFHVFVFRRFKTYKPLFIYYWNHLFQYFMMILFPLLYCKDKISYFIKQDIEIFIKRKNAS